MDPQHRHFLECAWEAIENAGHPPRAFRRFDRRVCRIWDERLPDPQPAHQSPPDGKRGPVPDQADRQRQRRAGHARHPINSICAGQASTCRPPAPLRSLRCILPARVCSTSNATWHWPAASPSRFPHGQGYLYREGEILSRDGHCRPSMRHSSGTVFSSGLGIVVLAAP